MHHLRAIALATCFAASGCATDTAPHAEHLAGDQRALKLSDAEFVVQKPVTSPVVGTKLNESIIGKIRPGDLVKEPVKDGANDGGKGEDRPAACSRTALWLQDDNNEARACPQLKESKEGRWQGHFVFGEKPAQALARACAYDWRPYENNLKAAPDMEDLTRQLSQHGKGTPELDCPVLSGLSAPDPLDVELWKAQRETALMQAGQARFKSDGFKGKTFVGVIDSAAVPFDQPGPADNYGHGRLVGRIIQDLTCAEDLKTCASEIRNFLALPYLVPDVVEPLGGKIGRREDLARAIHQGVDAFARALEKGQVTQAVFNLSLGWDPVHGGLEGKPEAFSAGSGTVYLALMRAACAGVITVAAAGNAHGPTDKNAVLPAAWEALRGPTPAQCKRFLAQEGDQVFLREQRLRMLDGRGPFVTAVSAVDERDASLATTRDGATPKLVAYGLSWVTSDNRYGDERAGRTDVLTGTSLSTAVATAAIADVWAIKPDLPIREVLGLVYKSSEYVGDLVREGPVATLCGPTSCEEVRRVSVCNAVRAAGFSVDCETVPAGHGMPVWSEPLFERPSDVPVPSASCVAPSAPESALAEPWTHCQPDHGACSGCLLVRSTGATTLRSLTGALSSSSQLFLITDSGATAITRPAGGYPDAITTKVPPSSTSRAVLMRNVGTVASPSYLSEDINLND